MNLSQIVESPTPFFRSPGSSSRELAPRDEGAPLSVPRLTCPFPSRLHSLADAVEEANLRWLASHDLLPIPGIEAKLRAAKLGRLAARGYPEASFEALSLVAAWASWLFIHDDESDETGLGADPVALRQVSDARLGVLADTAACDGSDRLSGALWDLRHRMIRCGGARFLARFLQDVEDYFAGTVWEAENRQSHRVPDLDTYVRVRDATGAIRTFYDLHEIAGGAPLPIEARQDPMLVRMASLANRAICWENDLFSAEKERSQGDCHNLVLILHHEGVSLSEAVTRVARLHDEAVRAFVALVRRFDDRGAPPGVHGFVSALGGFIRANFDWSVETGRYRVG